MSDPFVGQIEALAFGYTPPNWALCQGQMLPIAQYQQLFAVLGTTFGGDGTTTFALPDLRGRVAIGAGTGPNLSSYVLGQSGGEAAHTLAVAEIPTHTHAIAAVDNGTTGGVNVPGNTVVLGSAYDATAGKAAENVYTTAVPTTPMGAVSSSIGGQPHENRMPFLAINYAIALLVPGQTGS